MSLFPRDYTLSPIPSITSSPSITSPALSSNYHPSPAPSSFSSPYPTAFTSPYFNRDPNPDDERAMASYERRESPGFIAEKEKEKEKEKNDHQHHHQKSVYTPRKLSCTRKTSYEVPGGGGGGGREGKGNMGAVVGVGGSGAGDGGGSRPGSPSQANFVRRGSPLGPSGQRFPGGSPGSRIGSEMDFSRGSYSLEVPSSRTHSPMMTTTMAEKNNHHIDLKAVKLGQKIYNTPASPSPSVGGSPSGKRKMVPGNLSPSWKADSLMGEKYTPYDSGEISPGTVIDGAALPQYARLPTTTARSPLRDSPLRDFETKEDQSAQIPSIVFNEKTKSTSSTTTTTTPPTPASKWNLPFSINLPTFDIHSIPTINLQSIAAMSTVNLPSLSSIPSPFSTPPRTPDFMEPTSPATTMRRNSSWNYTTYALCMEGAELHEDRGREFLKAQNGDAGYELKRASELYGSALGFKPDDTEALLRKSHLVLALAEKFTSPQDGVAMLRDSLADLYQAINLKLLQRSIEAIALQAETSTLIAKILMTTVGSASSRGNIEIWEAEIGQTARMAVDFWEDAACLFIEKIDRQRGSKQRQAAIQAADALMRLADAAMLAGNLSPDSEEIESFHGVVEVALDQASAMVMLAKPSPCASGLANPFLTHVHLLSCKAKMARIQHYFALGHAFNEEDIRTIIQDVETLTERESKRAKSMRGAKAAGASASAFKAAKQLADTKLAYANLLRHAWRMRKATDDTSSRSSGAHSRSASSESNHQADVHRKVSKPRFSTTPVVYSPQLAPSYGTPDLLPSDAGSQGRSSLESNISGLSSDLGMADAQIVMRPSIPALIDDTFTIALDRRKSWMASSNQDNIAMRKSRMSSIALPPMAAGTTVRWGRKSSIISCDGKIGNGIGIPFTLDLVDDAWDLLESAIKQYKIALTLLASSDMPHDEMTMTKSETLLAISECSLFQASLSLRSMVAKERRSPCITTAEVYASWAAREIGWSSILEPTSTTTRKGESSSSPLIVSWQAIQLGQMAIMTVLRAMWHRENENLEILSALKPVTNSSAEMHSILDRLRKRVEGGEMVGMAENVGLRFWSRTERAELSFGDKEKGFWKDFLRVQGQAS